MHPALKALIVPILFTLVLLGAVVMGSIKFGDRAAGKMARICGF